MINKELKRTAYVRGIKNRLENTMDKVILAKVGDIELTKEDMIAIMRNLPEQQAQEVAGIEGRKRLLDEMVAGELFYLNGMENGYENDEQYIKMLEEHKRTLMQRYAIQKVLDQVKVADEDLKAYYEANKASYVTGPQASAKHILMAEEDEIIKVKAEIDAGLDFAEAAAKYSTCPSKDRGGDLGSFEQGRMVPEFEAVAFAQEIGTISEPVKTQFGYHLILVSERTDAGEKPFEEVAGTINQELMMQKQSEVYHAEVDALKAKYTVEINEEALQ